MQFNAASPYIRKLYGMALSAPGFAIFIYPDPVPVKTEDKKLQPNKRLKFADQP